MLIPILSKARRATPFLNFIEFSEQFIFTITHRAKTGGKKKRKKKEHLETITYDL